MADSKNFSEPILRVGDGVQAEESGLASNQPGMADPSITYKPANQRWEYTNDGVLSHVVGALPQFGTQAEAIAAGINQNGLGFYHTASKNIQYYLDDPAGNGSLGPGFVQVPLRRPQFHGIHTAGAVIASGSSIATNYNLVVSDPQNGYNGISYVTPEPGTYLAIATTGIQNQTAVSAGNFVSLSTNIRATGNANFTQEGNGNLYNIVGGSAAHGSTAMFIRFLPAGTILTTNVFQFNSNIANFTLRSDGFYNTLSIARIL